MGVCTPVCKCLRRAKYFLLLLVSLSVLVWIRTFSGEVVKSFQVSYGTTQTLAKGDSLVDKLWTVVPDPTQTEPPKEECPQESPLLRKWSGGRKERLICGIHQSRQTHECWVMHLWFSSTATWALAGCVGGGLLTLNIVWSFSFLITSMWMLSHIDRHYGVTL